MPETGTQKYIIVAQGEPGGELPHAEEAHAAAGHGADHGGAHNPLAHHSSWYFSGVAVFIVLVILTLAAITTRAIQKRRITKPQALAEQAVASMTHFCRQAIGPGGERFTPLVGTVFAFVLCSNLMGVLPTVFSKGPDGYTHLFPAPTANLSMTIAIALVVFIMVQAAGIKANGIGGYLKHFAGPIPALAPLMFPLEIIGAIAKPLSLSIRLFGNIFGEETVIAVLVTLAVTSLPIFAPIPFQFPMLMFGVFGSLVQAGVFTILTCAYLSLSLGDHEHHAPGEEHHAVEDEFGARVPAH